LWRNAPINVVDETARLVLVVHFLHTFPLHVNRRLFPVPRNYAIDHRFKSWHRPCYREIINAKAISAAAKPAPNKGERQMENTNVAVEVAIEEPCILEEINVEELAIDGICGVY
jgi:mycofactocin precursor